MAEDKAQRCLGEGVGRDLQIFSDFPCAFLDLPLAIAAKVVFPEIPFGKGGVRTNMPGETAFIEGDADDHADIVAGACREQFLFGRLFEDVVDHLHTVDDAAINEFQRVVRPIVVDRYAEQADFAVTLQSLDRLQPVAAINPFVRPDVELLDIDRLDAEVA
jgi:hypothetical protein